MGRTGFCFAPNIYGHIVIGGYLSVSSGEWDHNGTLAYDRGETQWIGHNRANGWILKTIVFNSSSSNALYGNYGKSDTTQPNSIRCIFIIRFDT